MPSAPCRPRPLSILLLTLLAAFPILAAAPARAEGPSDAERVAAFRKAVRSKDPKARERAFDLLRDVRDPKVVSEITKGLKTVEAEAVRIEKEMAKLEAGYEKSFSDLEDAKQDFEMSDRSSRAMARFNKAAKKISKDLDEAVLRLKNFENDITRTRAMLQQGVLVMGEILEKLEDEPLADALALLAQEWLQSKELVWKVRWVNAMRDCRRPRVTEVLQAVVVSEEMPDTLRVASIDALAARRDGWVLGHALELLKLPLERAPLVRAGVAALRRMHDKRAIAPLIAFLARQDLKLERNLAHLALVSLTGVDHGPYDVQWKKWWEESAEGFQMPADPKPTGDTAQPKKGTTFYGIQTFSDRILFIVDISGSMDKPQGGEGAEGKTKMEVCRQELIGSVFNLNASDTFNVIFFNHQVIPWQTRKVEASDRQKNLLKQWVEEQKPLGATNIYDSLEMGFKIAHRVTGPADLDTIFFLTDGNPTAGKIRDSARILEICREWNKTAKMTIHCIGIGKEHDAEFLKELARIGDGRYVRR